MESASAETFVGYGKIPLSGSRIGNGCKSKLWCATEKVHGANFSFHVDIGTGRIQCAKRTAMIKKGESFFGHFELLDRLRQTVTTVAQSTAALEQSKVESVRKVILFGEILGGGYPDSGSAPDQSGVWYSPRLEFMLFDIAVVYNTPSLDATFIPFCNVVAIAEAHGLFYAKPLIVGELTKVLMHSTEFVSTIPARLGLKEPATQNMAEGIVLRSWDERAAVGGNRSIMKIKSPNFSEGPGRPPQSADLRALSAWVLDLVNANRVAAAASKVGSSSNPSNFEKIVDEVERDIAEEVGGPKEPYFLAVRNELRAIAFDILAEQNT